MWYPEDRHRNVTILWYLYSQFLTSDNVYFLLLMLHESWYCKSLQLPLELAWHANEDNDAPVRWGMSRQVVDRHHLFRESHQGLLQRTRRNPNTWNWTRPGALSLQNFGWPSRPDEFHRPSTHFQDLILWVAHGCIPPWSCPTDFPMMCNWAISWHMYQMDSRSKTRFLRIIH